MVRVPARIGCIFLHVYVCNHVHGRAFTHAGSGMSALRRGDETMARLLEDSAKRRPHSARVDAEVETARSLSLNPTCDNITPADLQPQDLGRDPHPHRLDTSGLQQAPNWSDAARGAEAMQSRNAITRFVAAAVAAIPRYIFICL